MLATINKPEGEKVRLLNAPDGAASFSLRFAGGEDVEIVEPQPPIPVGSPAVPDDWRFVRVRSDAATLEGWVQKRFLGDPKPVAPLPLNEATFVRACVRAELESKADDAEAGVPADYLIAWSQIASRMANLPPDAARFNASGPFLLDDDDWQDYRDAVAQAGGNAITGRHLPNLNVYPAAFVADRDKKLFQKATLDLSAETGAIAPTFLNVLHARMLGVDAAVVIAKKSVAGELAQSLTAVLDAAVAADGRDKLVERWQEYMKEGGALASISAFVEKTGGALTAALEQAFTLMQRHYPEYFVATISTGGAGAVIRMSDDDMDALARVSQSEVGHFKRHGEDQFIGGLGAVVDTIFNRVAHRKYPNSIQAVINQPKQFSAINPLGSWTRLPAARPDVTDVIVTHVNGRLSGKPSIVKGSTHFLNPHVSSPSALEDWGNHVVRNAVAVFGNDAAEDVHFHGSAPGIGLPQNYALETGVLHQEFSGEGTPLASPALVAASGFKQAVVQKALEEWTLFEKGTKKEEEDPQFKLVGKYWALLNINIDGRTKIKDERTGELYNPPWSSAFVSFVVAAGIRSLGVDAGFKFSEAHCHYVQDFVKGRPNGAYRARRPEEYAPSVGDIVHFGRQFAKGFGFDEAKARYIADASYPSHSDIVIEVNREARTLKTLGGNVSDSVGRKNWKLSADGKLLDRVEDGKSHPWIAILEAIV